MIWAGLALAAGKKLHGYITNTMINNPVHYAYQTLRTKLNLGTGTSFLDLIVILVVCPA